MYRNASIVTVSTWSSHSAEQWDPHRKIMLGKRYIIFTMNSDSLQQQISQLFATTYSSIPLASWQLWHSECNEMYGSRADILKGVPQCALKLCTCKALIDPKLDLEKKRAKVVEVKYNSSASRCFYDNHSEFFKRSLSTSKYKSQRFWSLDRFAVFS